MPQKLTPRQKNLIKLMPKVESGEITQEDALKQAGYADTTARQQSTVLGGLRQNTKMQEALAKAGFTEEYLAEGIVEGTQADSVTNQGDTHPDYRARGIFYKLGAELMDAFPTKLNLNANVELDDLIKEQESTTPSA